jgi:RHS repeat-associated protein
MNAMKVTRPMCHALRSLVVAGLLAASPLAHAGGYVDGTQVITPATSIAIPGSVTILPVPTFNNATLTDKNTIAETNNDIFKTPSSADPVSTVTGNNFHDETDFVIKGRAGLNYAFTRTYNSAPSSTQVDLGLGFGWVHSYGMRLKSNDYGSCPNCTAAQDPVNGNNKTSSITYTDERGGDHNYLINESTYAVAAPQGEFDALALDTPSTGLHTLTFRNGIKYIFETPSGTLKTTPGVIARLKQIVDPWGNQLNFTYNAAGRLATVTDNLGIASRTGLVFTYDPSNHLTQIADWSGRLWKYAIVNTGGTPAAYHLDSTTNPLNQSLLYDYAPGTNNLIQITKQLRGVKTTFAYYQNGRTFNDADALGNSETLDYDLYRKSTRVTDPRGGIRNYEYDSAGRLTKLTEPDGAILQFANTPEGLRYSKTDGIGYPTQYSYKADHSFNSASDTYGNVTREQDALGYTVDTTYGTYDQVATVKDKRGTVLTTTFYTGSGTCIAAGKPNTVTISTLGGVANVKLKSYCWNADGTLASQTDYLSPTDTNKIRITSYTYDTAAHLNVQSATVSGWDGVAVTKSYLYDNLGRQQSETLQRRNTPTDATLISLTTTTTYDALDRVTQIQDALGNLFINRFDQNGQLWQVTHQYKLTGGGYDTRNLVTRTFDAADRVQTETDAQGGITRYTYDAAGNVLTVTDPDNHTLQYQYDEMNRRTRVTDANGRSVSTAYDLAGHPLSVTNGNNETTTTVYDKLGRPVSVTDPHGFISTMAYDANNNPTCAIDANAQAGLQPKSTDNCTTSTTYDELNRPTLVRDALNGTTQIAYDLLGNPLTRIDAEGRKYTWAYDGLGRKTGETDFTGLNTAYLLDQAGNAYQTTNRLAQISKITFDKLNRPTAVSYFDGSSEALAYDPAGNLSSVANATVGYSFGYDTLNRLQSKLDSRGRSLSFTWNKSGHIQAKTTFQGSTTSYTYDGAGTLVSLSNPDYLSVNYQYDNAGRLLSRVMSSGAKSLYTYDTGGWLNSLSHTDAVGTTVTSQNYTRDRVGNIIATNVSAGPNAGSTAYTFDALYRLTVVDAPGTASDEAFSYDHLGNRLTATRGGTTIGATGSTTKYSIYNPATQTASPGYTATYNNRLKEIRIGSLAGTLDSGFTFDNEGRLTSQNGTTPRTLTWDAKGRLKTLLQSGNTETYAYDPSNHRIGRSGGALGNLDYYLEGEHLESVEQSGTVQEKYFRGSTIDELVAGYVSQGGKLMPFFYQHDQVMSVSAQTKPNGGTQATLGYFAFGETQATNGTPVGRQQYTGRENDGNGCYYYRARTYCPALGQFISEDPKGFAAGQNFYAYVSNNPINANDPTGLAGNIIKQGVELFLKLKNGWNDAQILAATQKTQALNQLASEGKAVKTAVSDGPSASSIWSNAGQSKNVGQDIDHTLDKQLGGTNDLWNLNPLDSSVNRSFGSQIAAQLKDYPIGTVVTAVTLLASKAADAASNVTARDIGQFAFDFSPLSDLWNAIKIKDAGAGSAFYGPGTQYPTSREYFNSLGSGNTFESGAAGGFLLYPNKPNTNQMQSVYSK